MEKMKRQLEEQANAMRKVLDKAENAVTEIGREKREPSDGADAEGATKRAEGAGVWSKDHNCQQRTDGETDADPVETPERTKSNLGCGRMHKEANEWRRNQEGAEPCDAAPGRGHF